MAIISSLAWRSGSNISAGTLAPLDPSYRDNYVDQNKGQQVAVTKIIINLAPGVVPPDQPQVIEMPSPNVEGEPRDF